MMKNFHKTKHSFFLTAVAMETKNQNFTEIGRKSLNEKEQIDTF